MRSYSDEAAHRIVFTIIYVNKEDYAIAILKKKVILLHIIEIWENRAHTYLKTR